MATTLKAGNVKKFCDMIKTHGFVKNFWLEYRSPKANKPAVDKALENLTALGVKKDGSVANVAKDKLPAARDELVKLSDALKTAKSSCGKFHAETKQFIETYIKQTNIRLQTANALLKSAEAGVQQDIANTKKAVAVIQASQKVAIAATKFCSTVGDSRWAAEGSIKGAMQQWLKDVQAAEGSIHEAQHNKARTQIRAAIDDNKVQESIKAIKTVWAKKINDAIKAMPGKLAHAEAERMRVKTAGELKEALEEMVMHARGLEVTDKTAAAAYEKIRKVEEAEQKRAAQKPKEGVLPETTGR